MNPRLRTAIALTTGVGLTVLFGLSALVLGLAARLLASLFGGPFCRFQRWVELMPKRWGQAQHTVTYRCVMGNTVEVNGLSNLRASEPDEITVVIANHCATTAAPLLVWFVTKFIAARPVFLAKWGHLIHPIYALFFGWAIWAIRAGVFIRRWKTVLPLLRRILPAHPFARVEMWLRDDTRRSIRNGLQGVLTEGACLVIFPDEHRPNSKWLARDRTRYGVCYPGTQVPITHTLVPRSGGCAEILLALKGRRVRFIDLTNAFGTHDDGVAQTGRQIDATYYVDVVEITEEIPVDEAALRVWLIGRWCRKHHLIDPWRGEADPSPPNNLYVLRLSNPS